MSNRGFILAALDQAQQALADAAVGLCLADDDERSTRLLEIAAEVIGIRSAYVTETGGEPREHLNAIGRQGRR